MIHSNMQTASAASKWNNESEAGHNLIRSPFKRDAERFVGWRGRSIWPYLVYLFVCLFGQFRSAVRTVFDLFSELLVRPVFP